MGKRKKPQHKLGEMKRAEWKEIRDTIANQPPAPPDPPKPPATTETAEITAEVPVGEVTSETPTPPAMEVKAEISVTTPKTGSKKVAGKKKASKKRPAAPKTTKKKTTKKKTTKKSKPVNAPTAAPKTKEEVKAEAKVETNLSPGGAPDTSGEVPPPPTRPKKLSTKKLRGLERPWEKIQNPLPHHTLETVGLRRPKPKKEKKVKKETVTTSSASTNGGNDWVLPVVLGVLALFLVLFLIARYGGLEVGGYIRQPIAALT